MFALDDNPCSPIGIYRPGDRLDSVVEGIGKNGEVCGQPIASELSLSRDATDSLHDEGLPVVGSSLDHRVQKCLVLSILAMAIDVSRRILMFEMFYGLMMIARL